MADMMVAMKSGYGAAGGHGDGWLRQTGLGFAVLALGVQSWFWTRRGVKCPAWFRDVDAPLGLSWQERWAPRLTLIPMTLIAISPLLMAREGTIPQTSIPWTSVLSAWLRVLWLGPWPGYAAIVTTVGCQNTLPHQTRPRRSNTPGPPPLQVWRCLCGRSQADRAIKPTRLNAGWLAKPPRTKVTVWFAHKKTVCRGAVWATDGMAPAGAQPCRHCRRRSYCPEFIDDHLHTPTAALLAMSCIVPVGSIALPCSGIFRLPCEFGHYPATLT